MLTSQFQKMAAEAKNNREALDRLLTVSTPHERALLTATALLLLVFGAWLVFGDIARSVTVAGVLQEPVAVVEAGSSETMQALVWLDRDTAPDIAAGSRLTVELASGGLEYSLPGRIAFLNAEPLPDWPANTDLPLPQSPYRLGITFDQSEPPDSLADTPCQIRFDLGSQSPAALLWSRRS